MRPLNERLAESIERLGYVSPSRTATEMQQAMEEADALFHEMKSISEILIAAYGEIVGLIRGKS